MEARLPKSIAHHAQQTHIINIFFRSIPAYKAIIIQVIHITSALPKSGMKQNITKKIIFITMYEASICLSLLIVLLFLINHHAIKSTYHNLKYSQGCILGNHLISNHHLAHQYSAHTHGINTNNCNINTAIVMIKIFFSFWKNFTGILYTIKAVTIAMSIFLRPLIK